MTAELFVAWFLTFFPITISPGPANILLSSISAQFGVKRALPVVAGIFSVFVLQIVVVAVGIGEAMSRSTLLITIFQYLGAIFLFYLAYLFWRSTGLTGEAAVKFGFREGAVLQFFNFKALIVPTIMYTQFLDPAESSRTLLIVLTGALLLLIISSLLAWVFAASLLQRFFRSEFGRRWQGKIFAVLLVAVGIWILLR